MDFYPRPPRGGRRVLHYCMPSQIRFLSTPSARRATPVLARVCPALKFLSTPSARRATQIVQTSGQQGKFLSTPSARRATCTAYRGSINCKISIHALREEGDSFCNPPKLPGSRTFLSTPSARRATVLGQLHITGRKDFYPRPPRGGRPCSAGVHLRHVQISIHALREEGD